jgi:hypothetical protein
MTMRRVVIVPLLSHPVTCLTGRCVRAANGRATAAELKAIMN